MRRFSAEIAARLHECEPEIALLDTVPGVSRRVAEVLLAEIGADVSVSRDYPPRSGGVGSLLPEPVQQCGVCGDEIVADEGMARRGHQAGLDAGVEPIAVHLERAGQPPD